MNNSNPNSNTNHNSSPFLLEEVLNRINSERAAYIAIMVLIGIISINN